MTARKIALWTQDIGGFALQQLDVPGIGDVEVQTLGWDWKRFSTQLARALAAGEAPDVVEIGSTWTSRLASEGLLLNITDFAKRRLLAAASFAPRLLASCRDPDRIDHYYALPWLTDIRILFYNKEYVDPYLQEHPHAFQSWEAFEAMCEALRDRVRGYVLGWALGRNAFHDTLPWIWAGGGDLISASGEVLFDSDYTRTALRRLARLVLIGCAPPPPFPQLESLDGLRAQFTAGNLAIISAGLWLTHTEGWQRLFRPALYPPDVYASSFVAGSNVAIVAKYGREESDSRYGAAMEFVEALLQVENQVTLARRCGKLPGGIRAIERRIDQAEDRPTREALKAFEKALSITVDRTMPNVPNFVQIEEKLKDVFAEIWNLVGDITRRYAGRPWKEIETIFDQMIREKLTVARNNIEIFSGGHTVHYSRQEVQEMGLEPPSHFDLWLDVTSHSSVLGDLTGQIWGRGAKKTPRGLGPKLFQLLFKLASSRQRSCTCEELLRSIWGYEFKLNAAELDELYQATKQLQDTVNGIGIARAVNAKTLNEVNETCELLLHHFNRREHYKKLDTLRTHVGLLKRSVHELLGRDVVHRDTDGEGERVWLERDLAICVVLP